MTMWTETTWTEKASFGNHATMTNIETGIKEALRFEKASSSVGGVTTKLNVNAFQVFNYEVTATGAEKSIFEIEAAPGRPTEVTLVVTQGSGGNHKWEILGPGATPVEWLGPEPEFTTTAGEKAVVTLLVQTTGTTLAVIAATLIRPKVTDRSWAPLGPLAAEVLGGTFVTLGTNEKKKLIAIQYQITTGTSAEFKVYRQESGKAAAAIATWPGSVETLKAEKRAANVAQEAVLASPIELKAKDFLYIEITKVNGPPVEGFSASLAIEHA